MERTYLPKNILNLLDGPDNPQFINDAPVDNDGENFHINCIDDPQYCELLGCLDNDECNKCVLTTEVFGSDVCFDISSGEPFKKKLLMLLPDHMVIEHNLKRIEL